MGDRQRTVKPSRYVTHVKSVFHFSQVGKFEWDYGGARSPVAGDRYHCVISYYGRWRSVVLSSVLVF